MTDARPWVMDRVERVSLLVWVAWVVGMIAATPDPPRVPPQSHEEAQVRERLVAWIARDAAAWQEQWGDLTIPWDQARGHLAIVIDDIGRELRYHEQLQALRFQLTFSVLPGAVYTDGAQLRLIDDRRRYREIWLHLPMEPLDPRAMGEGAEATETFLRTSDDRSELQRKVRDALERVPFAVGMNNHMGSRLSAEFRAMDAVMEVVAARKLMFLDSRTTADTVAAASACAHDVPVISRDVFLDHRPDVASVRAALGTAAERAQVAPTVVIAHPRASVVEVLQTELESLFRRGIAIFPLSELLQRTVPYNACADRVSPVLDPEPGAGNH